MRPPLFRSVLAASVLMTFASAAATAATRTIRGTVAYRERMALPAKTLVEVKLVDVSRADAPSPVIAETRIAPRGQVPIPYRLKYDIADIVSGRSYALQARITAGGRLLFVTTTHHPIFAGDADRTDIVVERVTDSVAVPTGKWLAEDIRGGGVIDRLQTVLEIAPDGSVSGTGGCNRVSGKATIAGNRITFGSIVATLMACTPAVMNQEAKFLAALRAARTWNVDPMRRKLTLFDAGGKAIMVLSQQ